MDKKQIFTLLIITGLIVLAVVVLNLFRDVRSGLREKAKAEAINQGISDVKGIFGRFGN